MRKKFKSFLSLLIAMVLAAGLLQPEVSYAASSSTYYIKVNRQQNCVTVYTMDKDGKYTVPVRAMVCSTGANKATPAGKHRIGGKYRWHELDGPVYGQYCSRITGHVLFHSVYYSTTDPSTLNYNAYNNLGRAVSHGCVRLSVEDAKWIYDNCPSGTVVEVYDSSDPGPLGKPEPIHIDTSSRYRGWDPTDLDSRNPWPTIGAIIKGAKDCTLERCSPESKLSEGVTAVDYTGRSLKVTMTGKYNLNRVGTYQVTYHAADSKGKKTSKTVTVTVQDTKAPKVTLLQSELIIKDKKAVGTLDELKAFIKKSVSATDNGETLDAKYIKLTMNGLWKAVSKDDYGYYNVTVYAKDKAGNKSKEKTISVCFAGKEGAEAFVEPDYEDGEDVPAEEDEEDTPEDTGIGDTAVSHTPGESDGSDSPGEEEAPEESVGTDSEKASDSAAAADSTGVAADAS